MQLEVILIYYHSLGDIYISAASFVQNNNTNNKCFPSSGRSPCVVWQQMLTEVVKAAGLEQVDNFELVGNIGLSVVNPEEVPLSMSGSVQVGLEHQLVLKLPSVNTTIRTCQSTMASTKGRCEAITATPVPTPHTTTSTNSTTTTTTNSTTTTITTNSSTTTVEALDRGVGCSIRSHSPRLPKVATLEARFEQEAGAAPVADRVGAVVSRTSLQVVDDHNSPPSTVVGRHLVVHSPAALCHRR